VLSQVSRHEELLYA